MLREGAGDKKRIGAAREIFNKTQRGLTEAGDTILTASTLSASQTKTRTMAQKMVLNGTRDKQKKTGSMKSAM